MIAEKYDKRARAIDSLLCVGLDADIAKVPERFLRAPNPQFEFNKWIIEETHEYAAAFKPNSAFYEARGSEGITELKMTMEYLQKNHPDIVTILDAKRADIGNTNNGYVQFIFDWLGFDAVTIHPYLGQEAVQPFLDRRDKGCIVLCRTSNPGAPEFQDLSVGNSRSGTKLLWQVVAEQVSQKWNKNNNCMLVVGATYPEEMKQIRALAPSMTFLVPGIGAQGGSVEDVMRSGANGDGRGLIINSARGIIFGSDPREEAKKIVTEIRTHKK